MPCATYILRLLIIQTYLHSYNIQIIDIVLEFLLLIVAFVFRFWRDKKEIKTWTGSHTVCDTGVGFVEVI